MTSVLATLLLTANISTMGDSVSYALSSSLPLKHDGYVVERRERGTGNGEWGMGNG